MKREFIQINDKEYEILVGQSALENSEIIKMSDKDDIWFHFENVSGPHLILKSDGDDIPKRYINQIASKLFKYKLKVPLNQNVIYTEIKNIKLTNIPGSVITKKTKLVKFT